jgi:hypothetical protein
MASYRPLVNLVPDVLRDTQASVVDVEEACKTIIQLTLDFEYIHLITGKEDAEVLVAVMKAHKSSRIVQEYGCLALRYIAYNMGDRFSVPSAEVARAVLDAIQEATARQQATGCLQYTSSVNLYAYGLFVIVLLFRDDSEFMEWFTDITRIAQVLHVMRVNASSGDIQKYGCWVLKEISVSRQGREKINLVGGIDVIARAMRAHRESPEVTQVACEAFYNIATSGENCMEILNVGGIAAILDAIRYDTKHIGLALRGSHALSRLVLQDVAREEIGRQGGVALVVRMMSEHVSALTNRDRGSGCDVLIRGCVVLRIMARIDSNREEIVNTQGVEVILSGLQRYPESSRLAFEFCGAICELARGLALDVTVNLRLRIATAVVAAMQEHSVEVCQRGCEALKALALYAEAGVPIMDAGGREAVEDVMERWGFDKELQQVGSETLDFLDSASRRA